MKTSQTLALISVSAAMLLLAACGSDVKMNGDTSERKTANAVIRVIDNLTSEPLDSAKVLLQGQKNPVTVDANGTVTFSSLDAGTYSVQVMRKGFASRIDSFTITSDVAQRVEMRNVSIPVRLPKIGQTKSGSVYILDTNGNQVPAKGANLFINLGANDYVKALYTTVTDSSGKYTFDSLPEGIEMFVGMYEYSLNGEQFPLVSAIAVIPATPLTNTLAVTASVIERNQDSLLVIVDGKALSQGSVADLVVNVTDHYTGQPLQGATVSMEGTTKTATSDAVGQAIFHSVELGKYSLRVTKDSTYAKVRLQANCIDNTGSGSSSVQHCSYSVYLPKVGVSLSGLVRYDSLGVVSAAASVPVSVNLSAVANTLGGSGTTNDGSVTWVNPMITTTTDANGNFTFTNLPEGIAVSATSSTFQHGVLLYAATAVASYASTTRVTDQVAPGTVAPIEPTFTEGTLSVLKSDSLFTNHDTISVTFSLPVNVNKVLVQINASSLINQIWSADGKSVKLIPLSGKWAPAPSNNAISFTNLVTQEGQTSADITVNLTVHETALAIVYEDNADSLATDTTPAIYTFSTVIDTTKTIVHVYSESAGNPEILVNSSNSSDHKTIKILPQSGHWSKTDTYYATISVTTLNNQTQSFAIGTAISTGIAVLNLPWTPKAIASITVVGYQFNGGDVIAQLKWTTSDSIMSYIGYGSTGTNPFVSLGNFTTSRFDTTYAYTLGTSINGIDFTDPAKLDAENILVKGENHYGNAYYYGGAPTPITLAPAASTPATVTINTTQTTGDAASADVTITGAAGADTYVIALYTLNPDNSLGTLILQQTSTPATPTTPIAVSSGDQPSGTRLVTYVRPIKTQTAGHYDAVIGSWQKSASVYTIP